MEKTVFAIRLKELRVEAGLSQGQVAQMTDIAPNTYQKYEYAINEPSIYRAATFADIYDVSLDYLCGRIDNKKKSSYRPQTGSRIIFSERLKVSCKRVNFTQVKLGEYVNLRYNEYQKYESNSSAPGVNMATKFANALNVSLDYLCGRVDDPTT